MIAGVAYAAGAVNPDNSCQICDPSADSELWADLAAGASCQSDGLSCTVDACDGSGGCRHAVAGGCLIEQACVGAGAPAPRDACLECNPAVATGAWSPRAIGPDSACSPADPASATSVWDITIYAAGR